MVWVLGVCWGVLLACPVARQAQRSALEARLLELGRDGTRARSRRTVAGVVARAIGTIGRFAAPVAGPLRARRRDRERRAELAREVPVVIDLLGVAIAAGCTPYLAVDVAATWGPPISSACFGGVIRSCRLGIGFAASLDAAASTAPLLRPITDVLAASDRTGAPVGPQLARLAGEERAALRRRAEAHARRVPVKLLFPLVFLVLPAFVLLTVVPGLVAGLQRI